MEDLINDLGTAAHRVILLLDVGYIDTDTYSASAEITLGCIDEIMAISDNFHQIVVTSGSFPTDLGFLPPASIHQLNRWEEDYWGELKTGTKVKLTYGDYGIKHPYFDHTAKSICRVCKR